MIKKASEIKQKDNIVVTIQGLPAIGKTTLALSAPSPVIFDCDGKLQKVDLEHKAHAGIVQVSSFQEIMDDLQSPAIKEYETIIFDTAGELINFLIAHVIKLNPKNAQADGVTPQIKAWGAIKKSFTKLIDYCRITLRKDVIIVCHVKEERKGEEFKYYMDVAGSSKLFISQKSDLMCMMEMSGKKRVVEFSPTENFDAKSAYGIKGIIDIPELKSGKPNTFMTDLFHRIDNYLESTADQLSAMTVEYTNLMEEINVMCKGITDIKSANKVLDEFSNIKSWPFCSKDEARTILKDRCETVGLVYDRDKKGFKVIKEESSDDKKTNKKSKSKKGTGTNEK